MVRPCCMCGIRKDSEAASKGIRFFRFPSAKLPLYSEWIQIIRNHSKKTYFVPKKNSIVCTNHFEDNCFNRSKGRLRLREGSKPTIFNSNEEAKIVAVDTEPEEVENNTDEVENVSLRLVMEDDTSDSRSPPLLRPLQEINSDFEENVTDPPDLNMYQLRHDYEDTGLTSFEDLDMIKMDNIGSVADILGPDPYMQEDSMTVDGIPESSAGEERDEVDGQTILSFASVEEMQEYVARKESGSNLRKTTDFKQIKGWRKFQQLTPSLSPSPCPSPTTPIPVQFYVPTSNVSESPPPTVLSGSVDVPATSIEVDDKEEDLNNQEEANTKEDVGKQKEETCQEEEDEEKTSNVEEQMEKEVNHQTSQEQDEPVVELIKTTPELGPDNIITAEFARYVVSAFTDPSLKRTKQTAKKYDETPKETKEMISRSITTASRKRRKSEKVPVEVPQKSPPSTSKVDDDEIELPAFDDSVEDFIVNEEEYQETYDVPGSMIVSDVECGKLFCRLGCICDSLEDAKNRSKVSVEHCSLAECMLHCVCGYQKGNPSSRRCFASLLKGNESFYSKINWSSGRRRRERRVPERFSEYHLGNDTPLDSVSPPPRHAAEDPKMKKGSRGSNSNSSRPSSPLKSASPPTQPATQQHEVTNDQSQLQGTRKKWDPIRIKVFKNEINLLRWDSFVCLSKVYVAPDQDIFCMEHSVYNCSCIETNRRIIRIPSKYVPLNDHLEKKTTLLSSPNKNAKVSTKVTPPNKNVAKKHTHPNMRLANVPKTKAAKTAEEPALQVPIQEPVGKTSSMSKMRKLLQDERFNLSKLMTEEKTRAFDEDIDLNVPQGQTVQLVAWIRFHSIYQAGRMHVRFLSRRAGPVILVMRPNEIVAADITCDIQTMQGDQNAPEILKELLEPSILPEESSRYAFLLCDGVKWELVGCITLKAPETPTPPPAKSPVAEPKSRGVRQTSPKQSIEREIAAAPEVYIEEQHDDDVIEISNSVQSSSFPTRPATNPASTERLNAMDQKRKELEDRLNEIKQKLNIPQPKRMSGIIKPNKIRHRTTSAPRPAPPPTEQPLILEELLSNGRPSILSSTSRRSSKREADTTYLIPDQCILPDDLPRSDTELGSNEPQKADPKVNKLNLPDLVCPQVVKDPNMSMYPAAEQLAMFSRLIKNSVDSSIGLNKFSNLDNSLLTGTSLGHSSKQPKSRSQTAPDVPLQSILPPPPPPLTKPPELKMLKLQPIGPNLPSGTSLPNIVRRIRILPPPALVAAKGGNTSQPFSRKGTEPRLIKQQRMHWSRVGVKPPVIAKTNPSADTSVSEVPPAATVSSELSDQYSNQPTPVVSNDGVLLSTVTPVAFIPDLQSKFTGFPEVQRQQVEENEPKTLEEVVIPDLPKTASPLEVCVFPKILTAEVSTVQSKGNETQSLKIILEAMTGKHQELCPNRASMLLPLHSIDDKWCLVALNSIPKCGFCVPGLSVFIPDDLLGRVASTAIERKARVSFPLRSINKDSAFKPGFGVYGTPQLPRHVFIGPFPSSYVESCSSQPCMKLITLTKPATSDSGHTNNASSLLRNLCMKSSESTTSATFPTEHEQKIAQPETVPVENSNQKEEKSDVNYCTASSSDEEITVVGTLSNKTNGRGSGLKEEVSEENTEMDVDDVENKKSETVNEMVVDEPLPDPPLLPEVQVPKPRKFIARVEGLPAMTLSVYPDGVSVKHPFNTEEMLRFTSIDKAKCWIQKLANRTLKELNGSNSSRKSDSPDDLTSEDEIVDVCGENEDQGEETGDSTSATSRSQNKRIRRMTEKARILAASKSKSSRHNSLSVLKRSFSMSATPMTKLGSYSSRSSIQRQLHIRKEQERRGLLAKLLRDLDALLNPNGDVRPKVVVLKNATAEIKHLEMQANQLKDNYEVLKTKRAELLTEREKRFNALPDEMSPIFSCLMESLSLPSLHLHMAATNPVRRNRVIRKFPNQERGGRFQVEIPIDSLMGD